MGEAPEENTLIARVRSGEDRRLRLMAASGILPLESDQILSLQLELVWDDDEEISGAAADALRAARPRALAEFIAEQAPADQLIFFVHGFEDPAVLGALVERKDVPLGVLKQLARRLPPVLQEQLSLREEVIEADPSILDALAANPRLAPSVERRIEDYRRHMLPPGAQVVEEAPAKPEDELGEEERVREDLAKAARAPASGDLDDETGLTEGQIRILPVPTKMKLARRGTRQLRNILVRDSNAIVALAVLGSKAISEDEVALIAKNRQVAEEVLEEIAKRREWLSRPQVVGALVSNPRTPVAVAMRLVPRLSVRELRNLRFSHDVSPTVRARARQIYELKTR